MVHVLYVQRDKEELKEAVALLTAQQTSLEIIVNMCCFDGEYCGHKKSLTIGTLHHHVTSTVLEMILCSKYTEMSFLSVCVSKIP